MSLSPARAWSVEQAQEEQQNRPAKSTEDATDTGSTTIYDTQRMLQDLDMFSANLDVDLIELFNTDDVHRILEGVSGVQVRDEDGYGLRPNIGIRGVASDRSAKITLTEDGVLLGPAPYAAPAAYYFPLATRMVQTEVYKGPVVLGWGPATVGGAVNMKTAEVPVSGWNTMLDIGAGSFGYQRNHARLGVHLGRWGVLAEFVQLRSDGFKELETHLIPGQGTLDDRRLNTGFRKREGMLKLRWQSSLAKSRIHQVQLKLGLSDEQSNETYLGLTTDDFSQNPLRRYPSSSLGFMRWERTQAVLSYAFVAERSTLKVDVYRHDFFRSWRKANRFGDASLADVLNSPFGLNQIYYEGLSGQSNTLGIGIDDRIFIGPNRRSYFSQGVQAKWSRTDGLGWDVGARLHQDQIERDHLERPYRVVDGGLVDDVGVDTQTTDNKGKATALSGHIIYKISLNGIQAQEESRWLLEPGIRAEHIRTQFVDNLSSSRLASTQSVWLPGLRLTGPLSSSLGLIAGVHRGFSPTAPGQSSDVRPETSINAELGIRGRVRQKKAQSTRRKDAYGLSSNLLYENRSPKTQAFVEGQMMGFYTYYDNLNGICGVRNGCDNDVLGDQFSAGTVQIYGLETDIVAETPLSFAPAIAAIRLSHTWTRSAFLTSFDSPFPLFGSVRVGDALPYLPEHQLKLTLQLEGAKRDWGVVPAWVWVSEQRDQAGQGILLEEERIPARGILHLAAYKDIGSGLRISASIDNVLNQIYPVSRRPFGLRPNRPLTAMVGLRWQR